MMDRRAFLKLAAAAGGGLLLGINTTGCTSAQVKRMRSVADQSGAFQPNAYLTITPEGRVILASPKAEMGQGVWTGLATLVAEELEVPMSAIEPFHAPAMDEFRTSVGEASIDTYGLVGMQITGGSSSLPESYFALRRAAATAREMLITVAAKRFGVSRASCVAQDGKVIIPNTPQALGYGELTKEAAALEIVEEPKLKARKDFKIIGKGVTRVDARAKVDGTAVFGGDVRVEGMVTAYVIHPPTLGAQASKVDEGQARQSPGVVDIFAFERGVAVIAQKYWQARRAALMLKIEWKGGILAGLDTDALTKAATKRVKEPGNTIRDDGDVDSVFERDDLTVVEAVYSVPYLAHAPMEPQNCVAHVKKDGSAEIWAPIQSPTLAQEVASRLLDVHRDMIKVNTTMLGGGFGRRLAPDFVAEALMLSRRVKKPVRVMWSREDDTQQGYYRPLAVNLMRGAVDKGGRTRALLYRSASQPIVKDQSPFISGIFADWIPLLSKRLITRANLGFINTGSFPDILATEGARDTPYVIPNVRVQHIPIRTRLPVAFWRSVGHSFNAFVMESFIDELALAAKADPVEYRRGMLGDSPRHLAVLDKVVEISGWGKTDPPAGYSRGVAVHKAFGTYVAEVVEAGVFDNKIKVGRVFCAVDCGVVVNPDVVRAQMESAVIFGLSSALMQEITLKDGKVQQGNFDTYPALRMHDSPRQIEVHLMESDERPFGVGEPGLPPVLPALANAIYAATGTRLRSLPLQKAWDNRSSEAAK